MLDAGGVVDVAWVPSVGCDLDVNRSGMRLCRCRMAEK